MAQAGPADILVRDDQEGASPRLWLLLSEKDHLSPLGSRVVGIPSSGATEATCATQGEGLPGHGPEASRAMAKELSSKDHLNLCLPWLTPA